MQSASTRITWKKGDSNTAYDENLLSGSASLCVARRTLARLGNRDEELEQWKVVQKQGRLG